jgi:hypothetical protein
MRQTMRYVGESGVGPATCGVQYKCLGIPVPGVESLGCSQFVQYHYICSHALAAAQQCGERGAFIDYVLLAAGAQRPDGHILVANDVFNHDSQEDAEEEFIQHDISMLCVNLSLVLIAVCKKQISYRDGLVNRKTQTFKRRAPLTRSTIISVTNLRKAFASIAISTIRIQSDTSIGTVYS